VSRCAHSHSHATRCPAALATVVRGEKEKKKRKKKKRKKKEKKTCPTFRADDVNHMWSTHTYVLKYVVMHEQGGQDQHGRTPLSSCLSPHFLAVALQLEMLFTYIERMAWCAQLADGCHAGIGGCLAASPPFTSDFSCDCFFFCPVPFYLSDPIPPKSLRPNINYRPLAHKKSFNRTVHIK